MNVQPGSEALVNAQERINSYQATNGQQLDLTGLGLTAVELKTLMPAIHRLSNLRLLNLSDTPISYSAFQEMNLAQIWGTVKANISFGENDSYIGDVKWGNLSGNGVRNLPNGDTYQGGFQQGNYNGQGRLERANGNLYEGSFKNGAYHGQGIFKRADGTSYEGEFAEGRINGKGAMTYPNGDVQKGTFENGYMLFAGPGQQKKPNDTVTLLARSSRMQKENRIAKYEQHKHKEGGAPIKVVVTDTAKEIIEALNQLLEANKGIKAFKLAFNQHSGDGVKPDIALTKEDAAAILQLLVDKGIEDIKISSHSCDLCEVKEFMEVAPGFTKNAQISILTVPDGKYAYEGWKQNAEGEKKFTSFYIGEEGEYLPRDKHVFEKQQKEEGTTQSTTEGGSLTALTAPLNREKAKPATAKTTGETTQLQARKKTVHPGF